MSELPDTPENPSTPSRDQQKEEVSKTADNRSAPKPGTAPTREESQKDDDTKGGTRRTLGNHPADPNAWPNKFNFPPGVKPEEAIDPGNAIPGKAPVDNRSGKQEKDK